MLKKIEFITVLLFITILLPLKAGKNKLSNQQNLRQTYAQIGDDADDYIAAINAMVVNTSHQINHDLLVAAVYAGLPLWLQNGISNLINPAVFQGLLFKNIAQSKIIEYRTQTIKIQDRKKIKKAVYLIVANIIKNILPVVEKTAATILQKHYRRHRDEEKYNGLRNALISLQAHWKGYRVRKQYDVGFDAVLIEDEDIDPEWKELAGLTIKEGE